MAELDEQITTLMADYEPIIERLETIPRVARKCIVGAEVQYDDLGADWIARRHSREYQIARLAKQTEKLGAAVQITMPAA